MSYTSIGKFTPEEVLPFVVKPAIMTDLLKRKVHHSDPEWCEKCERAFLGHSVKMTSARYRLFLTKGLKCVECGIEGTYFSLERDHGEKSGRFHFNLYGIDKKGIPVMITKDHIVPKSKGGGSSLKNLQTMCIRCNAKKADSGPGEKVKITHKVKYREAEK